MLSDLTFLFSSAIFYAGTLIILFEFVSNFSQTNDPACHTRTPRSLSYTEVELDLIVNILTFYSIAPF